MVRRPWFDLHKAAQQGGVKHVVIVESNLSQAVTLATFKIQQNIRFPGLRVNLEAAPGKLTVEIPQAGGAIADHLPESVVFTMVDNITGCRAGGKVAAEFHILRRRA